MNPHPPRWGVLTVAVLLALVLLGWAWWEHDLLDSDEAGLAIAVVLIALGVVGIAATAWRSMPGRKASATPGSAREPEPVPDAPAPTDRLGDAEPTRTLSPTDEGDDHEQEARPQP
jgi:hypothetical protein